MTWGKKLLLTFGDNAVSVYIHDPGEIWYRGRYACVGLGCVQEFHFLINFLGT